MAAAAVGGRLDRGGFGGKGGPDHSRGGVLREVGLSQRSAPGARTAGDPLGKVSAPQGPGPQTRSGGAGSRARLPSPPQLRRLSPPRRRSRPPPGLRAAGPRRRPPPATHPRRGPPAHPAGRASGAAPTPVSPPTASRSSVGKGISERAARSAPGQVGTPVGPVSTQTGRPGKHFRPGPGASGSPCPRCRRSLVPRPAQGPTAPAAAPRVALVPERALRSPGPCTPRPPRPRDVSPGPDARPTRLRPREAHGFGPPGAPLPARPRAPGPEPDGAAACPQPPPLHAAAFLVRRVFHATCCSVDFRPRLFTPDGKTAVLRAYF